MDLLNEDQEQDRSPPPPVSPVAEEETKETQVDGSATTSSSTVESAGSGRVFFLLKVRTELAATSRLTHIARALSSGCIGWIVNPTALPPVAGACWTFVPLSSSRLA